MIGRLFLVGLVALCGTSFAQSGGSIDKKAHRFLVKHRWEKAESRLRKSLAKDPVNPSARFLMSTLYFERDNPAFQLDSAYYYSVTALTDYTRSSGRTREKLVKAGIDSLGLIAWRARIDSAAFEEARRINTEAAYLQFLSHFPSAMQRELATQLRDEVAFQDATRENTYQGYLRYLNRYPRAERADEARSLYERLLYETKTRDGKLTTYERFLTTYPESPFKEEVIRNIFEISTADGSIESFLAFIARYPSSDEIRRAHQLIFHILADEEDAAWPGQFLNDSLQHLLDLQNTFMVPVYSNRLYGFIDENGREIVAPRFENLDPEYLCGKITDDVLVVDERIILKNGSVVYEGKIDNFTDLGAGFLKVVSNGHTLIVHKAGFIVDDQADDARVLCKKYLAVREDGLWQLRTLTGRNLRSIYWDDAMAMQNIVVTKLHDKFYLHKLGDLARAAEADSLQLPEALDQAKLWPGGFIWAKSGEFEGVLDQDLNSVIRFDRHSLGNTGFAAAATLKDGIAFYNWSGQRSSRFERATHQGHWAAVKKNGRWLMFDPIKLETVGRSYDTIRTEGPFRAGVRHDTTYVHFPNKNVVSFFRPGKIQFVPGMDTSSFLLIEEQRGRKSVYDLDGNKLFTGVYDQIDYAGKSVFVVTKKEKKGLLNMRGEILLKPEYDALASATGNVISILLNKRFGAYNVQNLKLIRPQYEKNVTHYNDLTAYTYRDGYFGFINWENKPVSEFTFDEIRYWDDSLALVREGQLWSFYDIYKGVMKESNLNDVKMIVDTESEKVALIRKNENFGVISSSRGVIIPIAFSQIINVGTDQEPLYFTEKHVSEASLFIVIYYDRFGSMLRKEIYDDVAEYDRIYCAEN